MNAKEMWECDVCGTVHDTRDEAYHCCPRVPIRCWVCDECGEPYGTKEEAEELGIRIVWGGDWSMRDYPHVELEVE